MNKISRTKAIELIENSKGKRFTVTSKTNNGDERMFNGSYTKGNITPLGYIVMNVTNQGFKSVNSRNISNLKINKEEFIIK